MKRRPVCVCRAPAYGCEVSLGRLGSGVVVSVLASDESAFVHGTVVDVDGGRTGVAVVAAA